MQNHSRHSLDLRQHLERHFSQHTQSAVRSGHQPGQIKPGDILHHPATILDHLAHPINKPDAQQIIPRRPGLHPARAGYVGGNHAPNRRLAIGAQQRPVVHRFKGQPLIGFGQGGPDDVQWRACLRHKGQGTRFI